MDIFLIEYKNKIIGTYNNYYLAEIFILSCLQNNFIQDSALIHHYKKNSCFKYDTNTITLDCNTIIKSNTHDKLSDLYEISSSDDTTSCLDYISSSSDDTEDINIKLLYKRSAELHKPSAELHKPSAELHKHNAELHKPSAELHEPSAELHEPSAELHEPSAELHEPSAELHKRSAELHEPSAELHKRSAELHERSAELQRNINMLKIQKEKINESKQVYESDLKLFNMFKNSVETETNFKIPEIFAKKYEIMNKLFIEDKLTWENFINNYKNENYYGDYFSSNSYEEKFANNSENDLYTTTIDEQIDISI